MLGPLITACSYILSTFPLEIYEPRSRGSSRGYRRPCLMRRGWWNETSRDRTGDKRCAFDPTFSFQPHCTSIISLKWHFSMELCPSPSWACCLCSWNAADMCVFAFSWLDFRNTPLSDPPDKAVTDSIVEPWDHTTPGCSGFPELTLKIRGRCHNWFCHIHAFQCDVT